jgi:hypothetical protein
MGVGMGMDRIVDRVVDRVKMGVPVEQLQQPWPGTSILMTLENKF